MSDRMHIELDLEVTDEHGGIVGELIEPGLRIRRIVGWLQLLDELQHSVERAGSVPAGGEPPSDAAR